MSDWDAISRPADQGPDPVASPAAGHPAVADWDAISKPATTPTAVAGGAPPPQNPFAEPDAPTWWGRRMQDIRGKQDPRTAGVGVLDPASDLPEGAFHQGERAKLMGASDESLADIYRKELGGNFVGVDKDANGYPILSFKDQSGAVQRRYINSPGLDWQDVDRGIAGSIPYLIGGGLAGQVAKKLGFGILGNVAAQGAAGAATSVATDVGTQALGSDQAVDPAKAATIGAISAAVPVAGRAIDAVVSRVGPWVKGAKQVADDPAAVGVKLMERNAGYDRQPVLGALDKLTVKPPAGVSQEVADEIADLTFKQGVSATDVAARTGVSPAAVADIAAQEARIQSSFRDMNLLEVLKTGGLQDTGRGGFAPEVVATRNLSMLARDAANTEGFGQNLANQRYIARARETPYRLQDDIDRFFTSGHRDADAAVIGGIKSARDAAYDNFRKKTANMVVTPADFGPRLTQDPLFKQAMEYAANAEIAAPGYAGKVPISKMQALQQGSIELTPANVLDMAHFLSKSVRGLPANTPEQMRALQLQRTFSNWIDSDFAKTFKNVNADYAVFKNLMSARENGAHLASGSGRKFDDAYRWFDRQQAIIPKQLAHIDAALATAQQKATRFDALASNAQTAASRRAMLANKSKADKEVASLTERRQMTALIPEETKRAFGAELRDVIADKRFGRPVNDVVGDLLSQNGQSLVQRMLGPEEGKAFIQTLFGYRTRAELGETLYGGPDTAYKAARIEGRSPVFNAASHLVTGRWGGLWDDIAKALSVQYRMHSHDQINRMMSEQGVDAVRSMLKSYARQEARNEPLLAPYVTHGSRTLVPMAESGAASSETQLRRHGEPLRLDDRGAGASRPPGRDAAVDGKLRQDEAVYERARRALARGAPPDKVRQRMLDHGIDPAGMGM